MTTWPSSLERMDVDQSVCGLQVWKAWLGWEGPGEDKHLAAMLSDDEQSRAAGFVFEKDRRRFIRSHAALRTVLGDCLEASPSSLTFVDGPHGKPELDAQWHHHGLNFNLAHSGDWAIIALACGRQVGVDVEQIRPGVANADIAQRYFSPREAAALLDLPPEMRDEAFFRCWTRKEAYLKALGCGLSLPLDSFEVSLAADKPAAILWSRHDLQAPQRWRLAELQPAAGYLGALVIEADER
jgi:4'-phosphopantetheinyl transferase